MAPAKEYQAKSLIMGRSKRVNDHYPLFVNLFDENDPHLGNKVPKMFLDFDDVVKVVVEGLRTNYLLSGNDLVIDNLSSVTLRKDGSVLFVSGRQR